MERSTPKRLAALCFCTALAGSAYALEMDATGKVSYVGLVNIGYGYVLDDNDD